jgi:hypothetical protein
LDFRDQPVKEALDKAIGPYRPERTVRSRVIRIAAIAALTVVVVLAFLGIIQYSSPRPGQKPPTAKPAAIDIILVPPKRPSEAQP